MKSKLLSPWPLICRVILGGIFIYASIYKIHAPGDFAHQIFNYKLIPVVLIHPIAIIIPWFQFICGVCLILGIFPLGAAFTILGMMILFQFALASALFRGLNVSCGCFKSGGENASWLTFGRDFLILMLAILIFVREWRVKNEIYRFK